MITFLSRVLMSRTGGVDIEYIYDSTIRDRWGRKVYSADSYQNNWFGTDLSTGIYYYELVEESLRKAYKGWLQILK